MSEILIAIANLIALLVAYVFVYPRFAGNDINKLARFDFIIGVFLLAILAPSNWSRPNDYTFFFFDANWWVFVILCYALLEIPFFFIYLKSRGLGSDYRKHFKSGSD
jgi:hypothetical protein